MLRAASGADGRQVMATEGGAGGQLILVTFRPEAKVKILHGENAGRDIVYHNIVTSWEKLADWSGEAISVPVPDPEPGLRQAVVAQALVDGKPGPVLGAVRLD